MLRRRVAMKAHDATRVVTKAHDSMRVVTKVPKKKAVHVLAVGLSSPTRSSSFPLFDALRLPFAASLREGQRLLLLSSVFHRRR